MRLLRRHLLPDQRLAARYLLYYCLKQANHRLIQKMYHDGHGNTTIWPRI